MTLPPDSRKVKALDHYDFSDIDICLMSAGSPVAKEWAPQIVDLLFLCLGA